MQREEVREKGMKGEGGKASFFPESISFFYLFTGLLGFNMRLVAWEIKVGRK